MSDPDKTNAASKTPEPRGFGEHSRGLSGEYAHEQGWGLNEEERTAQPKATLAVEGGRDYEYGARDFGDEAIKTSSAQPSPQAVEAILKD